MHRIAVMGATGAAGRCALDLIHLHPDRYRASVLSAYRDVETLTALCARHRPELAVIADPAQEPALRRQLARADVRCAIASGANALAAASASDLCDIVVSAIPGFDGANVSLAAAHADKRLLLADIESAVLTGVLLRPALTTGGKELIPLDNGLLASFQLLFDSTYTRDDSRLMLAGSGGPFFGLRRPELMAVNPEPFCRPSERAAQRQRNVNSASLMERGQQLIVASHLFQLAPEQIEVAISPQPRAHVRATRPGVLIRSLDAPSSLPEALRIALAWPEEASPPAIGEIPLLAEKPDLSTFRCLALAYQALQAGGDAPVVLNAANAVAVDAFLAGSWPFLSIPDLVEQVLTELPARAVVDIQTLSERDRAAREAARRVLRNAC